MESETKRDSRLLQEIRAFSHHVRNRGHPRISTLPLYRFVAIREFNPLRQERSCLHHRITPLAEFRINLTRYRLHPY